MNSESVFGFWHGQRMDGGLDVLLVLPMDCPHAVMCARMVLAQSYDCVGRPY